MSAPRRAMPLDEAFDDSAVSVPRRAIAEPAAVFKESKPKGLWRRSLAPLAVMAGLSTVVAMGVVQAPSAANETSQVAVVDMSRATSNSRALIERPDADLVLTPQPTATPSATVSATPTATPTPTPAPTPDYAILGKLVGTKYSSSAGVNVRVAPNTSSAALGTLKFAEALKVTNKTVSGWQQISYQGKAAWVAAKFVVAKKPVAQTAGPGALPPASGNYSTAPCKYGSSIESGLTPNTRRVFRAFCAQFPTITSYGGYRKAESWSYHSRGAAIDAMVYDRTLGWQMANWAAANADALRIDQVIYAQKIWTKGNRTWRWMRDAGNVTANHYDHVHISVGG